MSSQPASIAFDCSEEDYDAYQTYFFRHSKFNRRRILTWQLSSALFGSLLPLGTGLWLFSEMRPSDPLALKLFAAGAVTWSVGYGAYVAILMPEQMRKGTVKRLKKFAAAHNVDLGFGRRTIRIEDYSIHCEWALGRTAIEIARMPEPALTDSHVFFFIDNAHAFIVPKGKIVEGNLESLLEQFRRIQSSAKPTA